MHIISISNLDDNTLQSVACERNSGLITEVIFLTGAMVKLKCNLVIYNLKIQFVSLQQYVLVGLTVCLSVLRLSSL